MPQKMIVTTVTLGVHDPDRDTPEVKDAAGNVLQPRSIGLAHVPPGEPVILDADEADRILARWGGEEIADEKPAAASKSAKSPSK